jgi:alpha-glucosidase
MSVKITFFLLVCSVLIFAFNEDNELIVKSPDGQKSFSFSTEISSDKKNNISFSVKYQDHVVILPSSFELLSEDIDFSAPFSIVKVDKSSVQNEWTTHLAERSLIPDNYNQLKIYMESSSAKLNFICRAYNQGVAFAYEIPEQHNLKQICLEDELINYQFADNHMVWSTPERQPGKLTAQGEYRNIPLKKLKKGCERPLVIDIAEDIKIALAEAALVDYARLSFNASTTEGFGILSSLDRNHGRVKQDTITGGLTGVSLMQYKVVSKLPLQSPWRVIMMGENHGQLLENNFMIQNLNDPCAIDDVSWITPGKVLREGSLTTEGAFAAIDFVASHNMQYVHFDAGWYGNEMHDSSDATTITLDPKRSKGPFDMEAICAYAKEKEIKVMLYVNRRALENQLDELLPLYKKWGIAGIKFGFVRVGDQPATAWLHDAVKKVAEYQMIVDVHDEYRPTGFSRTYPNMLTQEGIAGDETSVSNAHTLITMFTRCLAGAADNTVCYYNKRVEKMGSHASQLAKTVCIFSPLQFLYWYDAAPRGPIKEDALWGDTRHIGNEPELEFFNKVPTTWDETKVLQVTIGEIGVIARRKGDEWFIGGINGETERMVSVDFSFLNDGIKYKAKIYTDDESVKTRTRVKIEEKEIVAANTMQLALKANNGFTMHLKPIK